MAYIVKNERGLTVIEVLATLTILSIIGVVIWNAFFQGYNYSQTAVSKNSMQQEANLIITSLTRIHQTSTEYTISNPNKTIEVNSSNGHTIKFENSQMEYTIDLKGHLTTVKPTTVEADKRIDITITINDKNDASNQVVVEATLSRL